MAEVKVTVATTNALLNVTETVAEIVLGTAGPQGPAGFNAADISAVLPATYDSNAIEIGIDQDAFDYIGNLDYAQFDTTTTATGGVGKLLWNDTDGTLEFQLKGGNVTLQVGQEEVVRVRNNTGSPLLEGTAVYISSANSGHINVTKASNDTEAHSSKTLGVLTENIANGESGYCTIQGLVRNLNTSALTEGATIWLGTNGQLTTTRPTAPNHSVVIGVCVVQSQGNATNGSIYVRVINGFELDELHNVLITTPANNQGLVYESATQLWKNKQIDYSWLANIPSTFTPSAHAASHGSAGSDPVTINKTQVTGTAVVRTDNLFNLNGTAVAFGGNVTVVSSGGTADYATLAGTAVFSDTSGTASYATNAGTAVYATTSGTADYSTTSGTADYATLAGTATYATTSGTAVYANTAGTATPSAHASTHGSAGSDAITINKTQVTGTAVTLADTATVTNTMLVNSSITLNGSAVALGGTATIAGGGGFSLAPSFLTMGA